MLFYLFLVQGDVYIHTLVTGRNPLDDPPSISEGIGGRVTDYRINVHCCFYLFLPIEFTTSRINFFEMKVNESG